MNDIEKAKLLLEQGMLVAIPTETVYGLAGIISNEEALKKIFELKERPFFDPLIIHAANKEQAKQYTSNWSTVHDLLAKEFWPGPLTIIFEKANDVSSLITSGLMTVAIRIPNHTKTLELLSQLSAPVAAPSANKFTQTSPSKALHVKEYFNESDVFVLDGGECEIGIESTIIEVQENEILIYRPGMISQLDLEKFIKENNLAYKVKVKQSPIAPGHMKHHYMPKKPLILLKDLEVIPQEHSIEDQILEYPKFFDLNESAEITARTLYQKMRDFDETHSCLIFKLKSQHFSDPKWDGIINRLMKASSYILSK